MLGPFPTCMRAAAIAPAESVGACVARFPTSGSLPRYCGGSASAWQVSRPARRSLRAAARIVAKPPLAALYIGVLQTKSLPPSPAPIATGWSDSCRAGFAPAEEWRLCTADRVRACPGRHLAAAPAQARGVDRVVGRAHCHSLADLHAVRRRLAPHRAFGRCCCNVIRPHRPFAPRNL